MAEEEKRNGASEALSLGASAAHTVQAALKTGKAAADITKGAAAGGPYGAAAAALWTNRKLVGKAAAALAVLLMLPVLFLTMLPGVLFDGYGAAYSEADPGQPILNSGQAITEHVNEITYAVNAILAEALEDVLEEIEEDFARSEADQLEIQNPYESGVVYNINLFLSQYSAACSEEIERISISDMEDVLRKNRKHLFSWTSEEETRESILTDPETGKEITVQEDWIVYQITYNGEDYFAKQVFQLDEEQMELAEDYASNLSLFLGDGLMQAVEDGTEHQIPPLGEVVFPDGGREVVYYNQLDERYADKPYGTDRIGKSGCGPTAMAIVVSSLTDDMVDPSEMAEWAYQHGYWCKGSGSYHSLIPGAAEAWGLPVSGCSASEPQRIVDALTAGKLVVAIMAEGHFTKGGHFIVLRGMQDGKILVADPASYQRSGQSWDLSIILDEASRRAGAGGPFWIIG